MAELNEDIINNINLNKGNIVESKYLGQRWFKLPANPSFDLDDKVIVKLENGNRLILTDIYNDIYTTNVGYANNIGDKTHEVRIEAVLITSLGEF